jgi:twinkle protein
LGRPLGKLGHSCGSRNGLQVFEQDDGTIDGYCYSCNTFVKDPYGDKPEGWSPPKHKVKTDKEIQSDIDEISKYGVQDIKARRLRGASLKEFGVKVGVSEADGTTPAILYFPYYENGKLVRYKAKLLNPKKHWSHSLSDDVDLFGWEQAVKRSPRKLIIVEGECDAVALDKILQMHTSGDYMEGRPAICSLPNGAGSALRDLTRLRDKINKAFKDVVFCFDSDEAGDKATVDCLKIFPDAQTVTLPEKDANECILKGKTKGAHKAATFEAAKRKNTNLVWGNEIHEDAKKPAERGVDWPWAVVNKLTRGIRTGETIYIGAAQKMGKSEVVNTLSAHLIKEVGWKCMVAKPEEANVKTYKLTLGKVFGNIFHDPDVAFDDKAYDKAGKVIGDKLCMVNLYQHLGWDTLQQDIRSAALAGCKAIFIDPITNLTNGMNSADANTKLQEIAQELSAMAKDLDVVIFIFCHLRNPESGVPHDRGGHVLTSQFAGSRAMGRSCNYMFGLEGNKDPELSHEERNMRHFILLDDREFGEVGDTPLYWDSRTGLFNEVT